MYILKTRGTGLIPDYIQIRDDNFVLITHFKANNLLDKLRKYKEISLPETLVDEIEELKYGVLKKIETDEFK